MLGLVHVDAFLRCLAIVLCVAAVTTLVFQRLRQPVVLGYILAGVIVGPHVPVALVADPDIVHLLAELGVILLMFSIGLELSLRKLAALGARSLLVAMIEVGLSFSLGFGGARLFGWDATLSAFAGATFSISSTTIVAKVFAERKVSGHHREVVFGVLVAEDLLAILLLAVFTAVAAGAGVSPAQLGSTVGKLVGFLVVLLVIGLLVVPRATRAVLKLDRPETTLVAATGLCFGTALLAHAFGYSVALGAFIAGTLIAESGEAHKVEVRVEPLRDLFSAIFFVAVGMQIDPRLIIEHRYLVLGFTSLVIIGKVVGVGLGALVAGRGVQTAVRAALSLAQVGEFSFLLAGLAVTFGPRGAALVSIAAAVSVLTSLLTPALIGVSPRAASFIDHRLPPRLQTFASLYGSWVDRLGERTQQPRKPISMRLVRALAIDALSLAALIVAAARWLDDAALVLVKRVSLSYSVARSVITLLVFLLAGPLVLAVGSLSRRLGAALALEALPAPAEGEVDLSRAPRLLLATTFQLVALLIAGMPLVALAYTLLSSAAATLLAATVLAALAIFLARGIWLRAADFDGHVKAGAEVLLAALSQPADVTAHAHRPLDAVAPLLPGLGAPVAVTLVRDSAAIGLSLGELNLRGMTGATVLAIRRAGTGVVTPGATERLALDDEVLLAGNHDAIESARTLLLGPAVGID